METAPSDLWRSWLDRGEAEAFADVVRPLLPALVDAARRTGLDAAAAEDAVQDVLAELARTRSTRPVEIGFAPWLLRAVRLRASTMQRGERRRRRREASSGGSPGRGDGLPTPDVDDEVERVLASLGDREREALRLRYLYDLEYREMAFVLGISEAACRVRVHRAAERLRARYGDRAPALLAAARLPALGSGEAVLRVALQRAAAPGGAVAGVGGLSMGLATKAALGGAVLALFLGGWLVTREWEHDRTPDGGEEGIRIASDGRLREEPRLEGRPLLPGDPAAAPSLPSPPAASPAVVSPASPEGTPTPTTMDDLIARIRRDVEPEAWTTEPLPTLEGRSGILIVRASADLLDAVQDHLDRMRAERGVTFYGELAFPGHSAPRGAEGGPAASGADVPAAPPPAPAAQREALAAIRTLLRRMAEQEERIIALHRAAGEGRYPEADRLLALLRQEEPDHPYAEAKALDFGSSNTAGPASPFEHGYPLGTPLDSWAGQWPGPTWRGQLRDLQDRAGLSRLALGKAARAEVLERGSVTLRLEEVGVLRVLREIQAETRVDVVVDPALARELVPVRLPRFEVVERPLAFVLDQLLAALPPGHRIVAGSRSIRLVRDGLPETLRIRYYDVRDLLGPLPPPSESRSDPPPGAPVLVSPPARPPGAPGTPSPPIPPVYVLPPR